MPEINVYDAAQEFKAALLRNERRAASQMARVYFDGWKRIKVRIAALQVEYDRLTANGQEIPINWLAQSARANALKLQIEKELARFTGVAKSTITLGQQNAVKNGIAESEALTNLAIGNGGLQGLNISWVGINPRAVEIMVGMNQPGSALARLLSSILKQGAADAQNALEQGILLGYGPRKVAAQIRDALGIQLTRALNISRTEMLRAYREAAHESFMANQNVVKGWRWMSAADSRTCPACFAKHGKSFPLEERLESHNCCRCIGVPETYTYAELFERYGLKGGEAADQAGPTNAELAKKYNINLDKLNRQLDGEAAFKAMTEAEQRATMGNTRWEAWADGKIKWGDLAKDTFDAEWGKGIAVTPLRDLLSQDELAKYSGR
jgi:SPP1 gp7 family putative phage head morphogenesis protein